MLKQPILIETFGYFIQYNLHLPDPGITSHYSSIGISDEIDNNISFFGRAQFKFNKVQGFAVIKTF
jgi:hypothetical protein